MKYRLKSRDLQAQLDRLSRGDFSRRLDEWNGDRSQELVNFSFGEETGHDSFPRTFETAIRTADIEEVIPYDPSTWNEWPNVQPPARLRSSRGRDLFDEHTASRCEAFSFGQSMKTKIRYRATIPATKYTKSCIPRLRKKTEIAHAKNYKNRKIIVFVGRRGIGVDIDEIYPEERAVFYWATEYVGNPLYDMGPVDVERYIPFRRIIAWRYERERREFPFPCVCRFIFGSAK